MCTVCGCGDPNKPAKDAGHDHDHEHHHHDHGDGHGHHHHHDHDHGHHHDHAHGHDHHHDHDHDHAHAHDHDHVHAADGTIDFGSGLAGVHVPGLSQERIVRIEQDIFAKNDAHAADNRRYFARTRTFVLNLVSSPGSGKTSLLVRAIEDLKDRFPIAVIEGDQQTSHDADRIRATNVPAVQVNTGKGCHLDAHMISHALDDMPLTPGGLLFIENVGNLVCPAGFDLGEAHKVVILSVTEGEDKPIKYPDMFAAADLMVLNKVDLLPYVDFDVERAIAYARQVNPAIEVVQISARTGEGLDDLYAWIGGRAEGLDAAAQ